MAGRQLFLVRFFDVVYHSMTALGAAGYKSGLNRVQVEFSSAGASSLDLEIICDFKGEAAELYNKLGRQVQRIAVDTANDNGWDIPFNRIVVHHADESGSAIQRVAA